MCDYHEVAYIISKDNAIAVYGLEGTRFVTVDPRRSLSAKPSYKFQGLRE